MLEDVPPAVPRLFQFTNKPGDVDIAGFVAELERSGYDGWYVLEQDLVLDEEPEEGEGPIADARTSLEYLRNAFT